MSGLEDSETGLGRLTLTGLRDLTLTGLEGADPSLLGLGDEDLTVVKYATGGGVSGSEGSAPDSIV